MKYKVYRARNRIVPLKVNLEKDYTFEAVYEAETKGSLAYELGKYWKDKPSARPLNVGDIVIDSNNKVWVMTEHMLFAEMEQRK